MMDVRENCRRILERIHNAAARSGRPASTIKLIAVTKTVSPENIRAAVEAGITEIGENRLQEALPKIEALRDLPVIWHFIGHLQTNKARKVVEHFSWVQCVDRQELAQKLSDAAREPLPVLVEVKLHEEPNKSGIGESDLPQFIDSLRKFGSLSLKGLMAVPPFFENTEEVRPYFGRLRRLADQFDLPEVSMGMSHDFEVAIEEGATMVRIGTALFGARS